MTAIVDIDTKRKMLFQLKRIRAVEETIAKKYSEGKMRCPTHLCTGQEAIAVGVCAALRNDDFVVSTHRSHGHYLAKGGDLKKMLAEIYGKATGCSGGKGGSMHLIDESVGFMGSTSIVGGTGGVGADPFFLPIFPSKTVDRIVAGVLQQPGWGPGRIGDHPRRSSGPASS